MLIQPCEFCSDSAGSPDNVIRTVCLQRYFASNDFTLHRSCYCRLHVFVGVWLCFTLFAGCNTFSANMLQGS